MIFIKSLTHYTRITLESMTQLSCRLDLHGKPRCLKPLGPLNHHLKNRFGCHMFWISQEKSCYAFWISQEKSPKSHSLMVKVFKKEGILDCLITSHYYFLFISLVSSFCLNSETPMLSFMQHKLCELRTGHYRIGTCFVLFF